jgi:competence protein ComGC
MFELFKDLWDFMRQRRKFWLIPILVVMTLLSALFILAQGSAVAPFIYTLF